MKKQLRSWLRDERARDFNDLAIQDRFLNMNYFSFTEHMEKASGDRRFRFMQDYAVNLLKADKDTCVLEVIQRAWDSMGHPGSAARNTLIWILCSLLVWPFTDETCQKIEQLQKTDRKETV